MAFEEAHRVLVKKVVSEMEVVVGSEEEQEMVVSASLQQTLGLMVLVMEDLAMEYQDQVTEYHLLRPFHFGMPPP